jgi:hypothetical protein
MASLLEIVAVAAYRLSLMTLFGCGALFPVFLVWFLVTWHNSLIFWIFMMPVGSLFGLVCAVMLLAFIDDLRDNYRTEG